MTIEESIPLVLLFIILAVPVYIFLQGFFSAYKDSQKNDNELIYQAEMSELDLERERLMREGDAFLYERYTEELDSDGLDKAIWTKSLTLQDGDESKAKFEYIREKVRLETLRLRGEVGSTVDSGRNINGDLKSDTLAGSSQTELLFPKWIIWIYVIAAVISLALTAYQNMGATVDAPPFGAGMLALFIFFAYKKEVSALIWTHKFFLACAFIICLAFLLYPDMLALTGREFFFASITINILFHIVMMNVLKKYKPVGD